MANAKKYRYEHFSQPLLGWHRFTLRVARHGLVSLAFLAFSLLIGVAGYHVICGLAWIDALLNACMILTGMGPVNQFGTVAAKLFSAGYALYSGVAFLTAMGVLFTPMLHRLLHRFHMQS